MNKKMTDLISGAAQKATWISFSKKRQSDLIEHMIKIGYTDAQVRSLFVDIEKAKLASPITLLGICALNNVKFDPKWTEKQLREDLYKRFDDLKKIFDEHKITKSMIKSDQKEYRFSIRQLLILAFQDEKLAKYMIDLAE